MESRPCKTNKQTKTKIFHYISNVTNIVIRENIQYRHVIYFGGAGRGVEGG